MNLRVFLLVLPVFLCLGTFVSCETVDKGPEPERERISSMPHNIPQSWEGQVGMPGLPQNY